MAFVTTKTASTFTLKTGDQRKLSRLSFITAGR